MSKKSPSLRDIARAAGVSAATVSLALRKHASIPESTRERIRAVAAELGYLPNPRVAELMNHIRRNRAVETLSETVALFWSDLSRDRFFSAGRRIFYNGSAVLLAPDRLQRETHGSPGCG